MDQFSAVMQTLNEIIWHNYVLVVLLGTGVVFTIWSSFSRVRTARN